MIYFKNNVYLFSNHGNWVYDVEKGRYSNFVTSDMCIKIFIVLHVLACWNEFESHQSWELTACLHANELEDSQDPHIHVNRDHSECANFQSFSDILQIFGGEESDKIHRIFDIKTKKSHIMPPLPRNCCQGGSAVDGILKCVQPTLTIVIASEFGKTSTNIAMKRSSK